MKLGRKYKLSIQRSAQRDDVLEIEYPLTIQFDIVRNVSASVNEMNLKIFNLSRENQAEIFKDRFDIKDLKNNNTYRKVVLQAGYNELSTVFVGNLLEAFSARQGNDIITSIKAQDGGFAVYNSYSSKTLEKGTSFQNMFTDLVADLKNVTLGKVGVITGSSTRGTVFNGNTFSLIREKFNDQVFIDLEKINKLGTNEAINGQVVLISSETGLLSTPRRQNTYLTVDIIFEPRIIVGQIIELKSSVDPRFDGQYKVDGIKHSATISGAVGGDAKTSLQLFIGTSLLGGLKTVN